MKLRSTALLALTAATASVALLAAPAVAAPFIDGSIVEVGDYEWQITTPTFGFTETSISGTDQSNAFDGQSLGIFNDFDYFYVACNNADVSTDEATGDEVLSCAPQTLLDLTVTANIRIDSAGDLARYYTSIVNTTSDPITFKSEYYADLGKGNPIATTSGDDVVDSDDTWSINDQSSTQGLNNGFAWGLTGAPAVPSLNFQSFEEYGFIDEYVLAAGETLNLAFYHLVAPQVFPELAPANVTGATTIPDFIAAVTTEFATFDGRLTNGLAEGTVVANWGTVVVEEVVVPTEEPTDAPVTPESAAPALAETGIDGTVPALGALLLMLGGLVFVGLRRRAATRSN